MVVICKFRVPVEDSELGSALALDRGVTVELETLVPSGTRAIPFFWIHAATADPVVESLRGHGSVERVEVVETLADASLVAVDWRIESDAVFAGIEACDGQILRAVCQGESWEFDVRFPAHDRLAAFRRRCDRTGVGLAVGRIYHGTDPGERTQFGLTTAQAEALALAIDRGYYEIPRECSTAELADELGITAQSTIERLRRAVVNLASHTLLAARPGA